MLSEIGHDLRAENFRRSYRYKYVARLEKEYTINNNLNFWQTVCTNDLFDIWEPSEPYRLFSNKAYPLIGLFRIYEIKEEFDECETEIKRPRYQEITRENLEVTLTREIISDDEFNKTQTLLESSIKKYVGQPIEPYQNPVKNSIWIPPQKLSDRLGHTHTLSEQNFENVICERLEDIEEGLTLVRRQYSINPVGRIDILCKDKNGDLVVVELKKYGAPNHSIIDQITGYMGYIKDKEAKENQKVRGIIIIGRKDERLEYSARVIPNLTVKTFKFSIE